MKFILSFIILFNIPGLFAQTSCPRTDIISLNPALSKLMGHGLSADCVAKKKQYKCEELEKELGLSDLHKVLQCDLKSVEANQLTKINLGECVWNGLKISGENLLDLAALPGKLAESVIKGFKDTQVCNASIDKKREMLKAFNLSMEDERFKLNEHFLGRWLEEATCAEVEKLLWARLQNQQNAFLRDRISAINSGRKPTDIKTGETVNIRQMLLDAFDQAQVKYECYTPKVKAEMICTGLTTLLADMAMGSGIRSAVTKIAAIGKSKAALASIRSTASEGQTAKLADAGKLLDGDRRQAAGIVLKRSLNEKEKKAIIEAHEVGAKEGRGFFSYTSDDIMKKSRLLKEAGFSEHERRLLMENGITGTSGLKLQHGEIARIKGEKLVGEGLYTGRKEKIIEGLDSMKKYFKEISSLDDNGFKKVFTPDSNGLQGIKSAHQYGASTKEAADTTERMISLHGLDKKKTFQTMINSLSSDINEFTSKSAKNYNATYLYKAHRALELKSELMERYYTSLYKNKFNEIDFDKMDRREQQLLINIREELQKSRDNAAKNKWIMNE